MVGFFYSPVKNKEQESQLYLNRVISAIGLIFVICILLISRLVYLQIHQHHIYSKLSRNNQIRLEPLSPTRGLIYDRHHRLLVENKRIYNLTVTPQKIKHLPEIFKQLNTILPISSEEIRQFYQQKKHFFNYQSIPIKTDLSDQEIAQFSVMQEHLPASILIEPTWRRHYLYQNDFSHVLGYVGAISATELRTVNPIDYRNTHMIGKTGIEQYYEHFLHGKIGYRTLEIDAQNHPIQTLLEQPAQSGKHLILSLDSRLQKFASKILKNKTGAIVALDPQTGDILCLVNQPNFNPNDFIIRPKLLNLDDPPSVQENSKTGLFNRAIQGQYPPGSTIKPILALKALDDQIINQYTQIYDPGWFKLPNDTRAYRDWKPKGHGWTNINSAIRESCSTFFYHLAYHLGITPISSALIESGLGQKTGIDLPSEQSGLVPTPDWKQRTKHEPWYLGETLSLGIGQSYLLATPLQLAQIACLISNRGYTYPPRLLTAIQDPITQQIETLFADKKSFFHLKTPSHWEAIINAMQEVISHPRGTGYRIHGGLKYTLAGKTGTAQVFSLKSEETYHAERLSKNLHDHSWFIGFAPVDAPKIALAIILENSTGSALIARQVLDFYFQSCTKN